MSSTHSEYARGILRITGAVVTNDHFVYTAGDHGSVYINKDALFVFPQWCSDLAFCLAAEVLDDEIETVVGAVVGGAILANRVAEHISKRLHRTVNTVFADRDASGFVLRRGYPAHVAGKNVLIVEDIINSGQTVRIVIQAVADVNGRTVRVAAIYNRGGVTADVLGCPSPIVTLVDEQQVRWPAADCPLCQQGVPINTDLGKGREFLARRSPPTS